MMRVRKPRTGNFIWLDLEMTGLIPETDHIVEIATVITDGQLNILEEGPAIAIHQSEEILALMGPWVKDQHGKSGLTQAVRESKISLAQAEHETLEFIKKHCPPQTGLLCGNSIWQDRSFLRRYMPKITEYTNYRMVDVTSVKELVHRWYPGSPHLDFPKGDKHRALPDVFESIEELKHYRTYFFITS